MKCRLSTGLAIGLAIVSAGVVFAAGCGDPKADPTLVKAVKTESKTEQANKLMEAKVEAEKQRKAQEKADFEAKRKQEIEAAASLPQEIPENMEAACDEVVEAFHVFMKQGEEREVIAFYQNGRRKKLGERRAKCLRMPNVQVAACQAHALASPLTTLAKESRVEASRIVMTRCLEKFSAA